MRKSHKIFTT